MLCKVENGEVIVLGNGSVRQGKKDVIDGEISDIKSVSNACKKAIALACKNADQIPDDIIVGINSAFLLSDTLTMNYIREEEETVITMEEIDTIIRKTEGKSIDRVKSQIHSRLSIPDSEMKLVTTTITNIVVDGNTVNNPVGFTGRNIKLGILNIFLPISRFTIIKNIALDLHKNIISIVPTAITLSKLVENGPYGTDANAFIDIGHSRTTVTVSQDGNILGCSVIPFGFGLLEDDIRKNSKLDILAIENLLYNYDGKKINDFSLRFESFYELLFKAIAISVTDIEKKFQIKNAFLFGESATKYTADKLTAFLEKERLGSNIVTHTNFSTQKADSAFLTCLSLAYAGMEL